MNISERLVEVARKLLLGVERVKYAYIVQIVLKLFMGQPGVDVIQYLFTQASHVFNSSTHKISLFSLVPYRLIQYLSVLTWFT